MIHNKPIALILGGSDTVFIEAEKAFNEFNISVVIAINNCMKDYPGNIDAAISLHPSKIADWLAARKFDNEPSHVVSYKNKDRGRIYDRVTTVIDYQWPEMKENNSSGSSGLYGVKVAYDLFSVDKVILAGVPMTGAPHYHDPKPWGVPTDFRKAWLQTMPRLIDRVKSYSGWTAEQLGLPTREWANG